MRRQSFYWTYLALAIVLTAYGGYMLIYHFNHGNKLSILSLVFLIIGPIMLLIYLVLCLLSLKNKRSKETVQVITNEFEPEPVEKPEPQPVNSDEHVSFKPTPKNNETTYERGSYSIYDTEDVYVKKVGYGSILRVTDNRILDMRNNTYYRIQGNTVNQDGGGPVFEISGNSIRSAFGGYLYEISGNNINKIFGGFYASISGNYITLFDSSEKYEITDRLSQKQLLAITALLFA